MHAMAYVWKAEENFVESVAPVTFAWVPGIKFRPPGFLWQAHTKISLVPLSVFQWLTSILCFRWTQLQQSCL